MLACWVGDCGRASYQACPVCRGLFTGTAKELTQCKFVEISPLLRGVPLGVALGAGTVISYAKADVQRMGPAMVKGFATIDNVALINVEGTGVRAPCMLECGNLSC